MFESEVWMQIVRLGCTPVKGMAHVALPGIDLTRAGPRGDRVFCLIDESGDVLRTIRDDTLMACTATWKPPVLMIQTPLGDATGDVVDGEAVTGSYWGRPVALAVVDGPWSELLGRLVGRPVRLCRVRVPGSIVWSGSVSIVTTSSLAEVARRTGRPVDDGARFRPTVVIDTGSAPPFAEDAWQHRHLRLGSAVVRIDGPMPRCAVVNRKSGSGGPDADVLAALAADRVVGTEILFGVHGHVEGPGPVGYGDPVHLDG